MIVLKIIAYISLGIIGLAVTGSFLYAFTRLIVKAVIDEINSVLKTNKKEDGKQEA